MDRELIETYLEQDGNLQGALGKVETYFRCAGRLEPYRFR